MASCVVLASGSGTNFEALSKRLDGGPHSILGVITDRESAPVLQRAQRLGIPDYYIPYDSGRKDVFEEAARTIIRGLRADIVVLAGFMRILSPRFVDAFPERIVNIHPALLPKYPGTRAIARSFESADKVLGITIHYIDHGVDSGPVIEQRSFSREPTDTLPDIERKIHELEHAAYPEVIEALLDAIDRAQ